VRDDLRHIDWKATARGARLTVREFAAEDERRITIVLDTTLTDDIDEENFRIRFERGVTHAASLVKHFIQERAEVRLILGRMRESLAPVSNTYTHVCAGWRWLGPSVREAIKTCKRLLNGLRVSTSGPETNF
jgi:uncharacterized protein (DUF58 family)